MQIEVSLKAIPVGKYAYFVHCAKDGGFDKAFAGVNTRSKEGRARVKDFGLQHYDRDFDPNSEKRTWHIFITSAHMKPATEVATSTPSRAG